MKILIIGRLLDYKSDLINILNFEPLEVERLWMEEWGVGYLCIKDNSSFVNMSFTDIEDLIAQEKATNTKIVEDRTLGEDINLISYYTLSGMLVYCPKFFNNDKGTPIYKPVCSYIDNEGNFRFLVYNVNNVDSLGLYLVTKDKFLGDVFDYSDWLNLTLSPYYTNVFDLQTDKPISDYEYRYITAENDLAFLWSDKENIILPNGIVSIGNNVGRGGTSIGCCTCPNLKDIKLPDTLERIGKYAFIRSNITSVILPNSVQVLEEDAFSACNNISKITICNPNAKIDSNFFVKCGDSKVTIVGYRGSTAYDFVKSNSLFTFKEIG